MMFRGVAAIAAMVLSAAAPASDSRSASFSVGGVQLIMPVPAGYCEPTDGTAKVLELMAKADTVNVTDIAFVPCGMKAGAVPPEYTVIKTLKAAVSANVAREDLIASVVAEMRGANGEAAISSATPIVEKGYADLGLDVKITGLPRPLGRDDLCAFLGGEVSAESNGRSARQRVGACITAVGGKMLFVYRFATSGSDKEVGALVREARAIAASIREAAGA